jgi:GTP-binding protein
MKFVDKVEIETFAGSGGPGAVSFRREKFVPRGGPDGGDGGNGGNIILHPTSQMQTLMDLKLKSVYKAKNGESGHKKNMHGKDGDDLVIKIPFGTMVFDQDQNLIADLISETPFVLAKGGKGGKGNSQFASSTNQTPRYAQTGLPGESKKVILELRLIAEIGLIGQPNAGKSTLLKRLTKANPKIAAYPFTTLYPNLGVLKFEDKEIVLADIPGIIEGASHGAGLGIDFLRHIDRTKFLLHLVEITPEDPKIAWKNYEIIQKEIQKSQIDLHKKKQLVLLNKTDLIETDKIAKFENYFLKKGVKTIPISAFTGYGIDQLIKKLKKV